MNKRNEKFKELIVCIEVLEEQLQEQSSESASISFNAGCLLNLGAALLVGVLTVIFTRWATGLIAFAVAAMLALSLTALIATRARGRRADAAYLTEIHPQLEALKARRGINQAVLERLICKTLPLGALLAQFHTVTQEKE